MQELPFYEVENILSDLRMADIWVCLSLVIWGILSSDVMQLKMSFGSQRQSTILQFVSNYLLLMFRPVKLQHFIQYDLILRSTWVKMELELVFHNAVITSKYCLIDQCLWRLAVQTNFMLDIQHLVEVILRDGGSNECFWKQQEKLTKVL